MPFYSIDNIVPVVSETAYVAPTATIIGDVHIGDGVYIAPGASLRGDFGRIIIAAGANIQDNCILHGFPKGDTIVEEDGHIGHAAVLHGCHIKKNAMVGIGAIILDNAVVEESAIVAAGAVVLANTVVAAGSLAAGVPATVRRLLSDDERQWKTEGTQAYWHLCQRALGSAGIKETTPLRQAEAQRQRVEDIYPELAELAPKAKHQR